MAKTSGILIAKEGYPFIFGFVIFGAILSWFQISWMMGLAILSWALAAFSCFFFRDPIRRVTESPGFYVSPADGRVVEVVEESSPLAPENTRCVKIFLSVFDVHVQRSPIRGTVEAVSYKKGKFLDARDPRASFENESNSILIRGEESQVVVKQIAGLIARRIICYVRKAQSLQLGQHLGLIRFGSQVDIYLPKDVEVCVGVGERVMGGVSVIALSKKTVETQIRKG